MNYRTIVVSAGEPSAQSKIRFIELVKLLKTYLSVKNSLIQRRAFEQCIAIHEFWAIFIAQGILTIMVLL